MKNSITKIKNSLEVSIEDLSRQKKQSVIVEINEQSLRELWDTMKHTNTFVMVTPDEEERKKEAERISVEIMAKYFPSLIKYMSLHIHETQKTPRRVSGKIYTESHCNQIVKTQRQKRIWETAKEKQLITHSKDL